MTTSSHQSFRDFRQSLARRGRARVFSGIMAMILGLVQALRILEDSDDAVIRGILFGLLVGMGLVVLVMGLQDARANRTDERARIAYNREQDERLREIRRRAGSPLVQTFSLVLVFLGCVAYSQWGIVALGSFMAAALFQLAASAILKAYWSRKI